MKLLRITILVSAIFFPLVVSAQVRPCDSTGSCIPASLGEICAGPDGAKQCYKKCSSTVLCDAPQVCTADIENIRLLSPTVCATPAALAQSEFTPSSGAVCATVAQCPENNLCEGLTGSRFCYRYCVNDTIRGESGCQTGESCRKPPGFSHEVCGTLPGATVTVPDRPAEVPFVPITPVLGVPIPGADLSAPTNEGGVVRVAFLAQYINAAYRYLTGIILVVAIVMCVYGGFLYLVGSAGVGSIQRGKSIIVNSIIGMLITISAFAILNTVNPATTNLKVLELAFVQTEGIEYIPADTFAAATGVPLPTSAEVAAAISKVAREKGIDECMLSAIAIGESGGRANAIGYDSNAARRGVYSRAAFIRSGTRLSGSTFTIPGANPQPTGQWTGSECRPDTNNLSDAQKAAIVDRTIKNDARFDPSKPPDYGLDTRFSIGLGIGQITMHPLDATCRLSRCTSGPSTGLLGRAIEDGGVCYSVPEILNPDIQMLGVAKLVKQKQTGCLSAVSRDPYIQARCLYYRYAGSGCSARVSVCKKTKLWAGCKGIAHREVADCQGYWLSKTSDYCTDLNNN